MKNKLSSRKLWLSILAAALPLLCQALFPEMPTEKIVVSVVGLLGGVFGIAAEDVQKIKQGVTTAYEKEDKAEASAEG
jgi:hypothetical protein